MLCAQVSKFWAWWKTRVTGTWGTCGRTIGRGQLWAEDSIQVSIRLRMLPSERILGRYISPKELDSYRSNLKNVLYSHCQAFFIVIKSCAKYFSDITQIFFKLSGFHHSCWLFLMHGRCLFLNFQRVEYFLKIFLLSHIICPIANLPTSLKQLV